MARLNTRPSYRTSSRLTSATPQPDDRSDQENRDPAETWMDKGKQRAVDRSRQSSLPTPSSDEGEGLRGEKRKRLAVRPAPRGVDEDEDEESDRRFTRYFDPNQDADERRDVKKRIRTLERDFQENRDDLLREADGQGLRTTISRANRIFKQVKQTNDATVDSRLLVNVSDLARKKANELVLGDTSTGIDVDEFLAKCITFMRNGGSLDSDEDALPSTSRRRRNRAHANSDDDSDHDESEGEPLDWEALGRYACYPYNSRPAVRSFLLGPLSVEKKYRKETQRRARNARDTAGREARPEELSKESLEQSDESGLTAICSRLYNDLERHVSSAEKSISAAGFTSMEELQSEEGQAILRRFQMTDNGGVSLFQFTLNPHSFAQSVENLFYVSFLIKEGTIGIASDSDGWPSIVLAEQRSLEDLRRNDAKKHQAVFSLDYSTWESLIDGLGIKNPMIPHRKQDNATDIQPTGWYT